MLLYDIAGHRNLIHMRRNYAHDKIQLTRGLIYSSPELRHVALTESDATMGTRSRSLYNNYNDKNDRNGNDSDNDDDDDDDYGGGGGGGNKNN